LTYPVVQFCAGQEAAAEMPHRAAGNENKAYQDCFYGRTKRSD
jgi:hypothetical protein